MSVPFLWVGISCLLVGWVVVRTHPEWSWLWIALAAAGGSLVGTGLAMLVIG